MEPDHVYDLPAAGSDALLDVLLRSSPVGLAVLDRSLRFTRVSDALAEMNGLTPEEHLGRTPMELLPDLPAETYVPMLERALAGEPVVGIEVAGETPASPGEHRHWDESFFPLRDPAGAVIGVGIVAIDATARRAAETALKEREATSRLILESAPSAMLVVASGGRIVDLNGEAERLFGYRSEELVGRSIDLLVPERYRAEHPAHRSGFERHPRTRAMGHGRDDLAGLRRDGTEFPAEIGLGVAPGRDGLVTCVVTDLSERRRAEAEHDVLLVAERTSRLRLSRLQLVLDASLAQLSLDDGLDELLSRVGEAVGGDVVVVLLMNAEKTALVPTASVGLEAPVDPAELVPLGLGVAGRAAATRRPVYLTEQAHLRVHREALRRKRLESMVAAPMIIDDEVIGVLQVSSKQSDAFESGDIELLPVIASRVALAVDRARAFDRERSIAEALQHSLLPDRLPELPLVGLAARYLPGTAGMKIGGDWYDVVPLDGGRVGLVIGDVMGHGVRAAAVMGQLRSAVRIYLHMGASLPDIAAHLNRVVLDMGDAEITTLLVAVLHPETGRLDWVSAGHLPPVVRTSEAEANLLESAANPPLGATSGLAFTVESVDLDPGSTVLLYTDGLVERRDESLEASLAELTRVVRAAHSEPGALCDAVVEVLVGESTRDDVAMLAIQLKPSPVAPLTLYVGRDPWAERGARAAVAAWLRDAGASSDESDELLVAVNEGLLATTVRRSGGPVAGRHLVARLIEGRVVVTITDHGDREPPEGTERGRGLVIMEALVDELVLSTSEEGHEVRLSRRLDGEVDAPTDAPSGEGPPD